MLSAGTSGTELGGDVVQSIEGNQRPEVSPRIQAMLDKLAALQNVASRRDIKPIDTVVSAAKVMSRGQRRDLDELVCIPGVALACHAMRCHAICYARALG